MTHPVLIKNNAPEGGQKQKNNTRENATKSWRVYITVFHKSVLKPSMQARKQTETKPTTAKKAYQAEKHGGEVKAI